MQMTGSAQGAQECSNFTAWKTTFDTRSNPDGIIEVALKDGAVGRRIPGVNKITAEQCEPFVEWYASATVLKTPDGQTTSVIVDSDRMLNVLGFTFDAMSDNEKSAFDIVTKHCTNLLKQSAQTAHAQLMSRYNKVYGGMMADYSPFMIGQRGGKLQKIGNAHQLNYYWYQHMYVATSIRDARITITDQFAEVETLPLSGDSLPAIERALQNVQGETGNIAGLSDEERKSYVAQLESIQSEIAFGVVDDSLKQVNWNEFKPSVEGLKNLAAKKNETESSLGNSVPQSSRDRLSRAFDERYRMLSQSVADQAISEYPGVDQSLEGLRNYKEKKTSYLDKYQSVLTGPDLNRLQNHLDNEFTKTVNESASLLPGWLESEVPSDQSGIDMLESISSDILGVSLGALEDGKYPHELASVAHAIQARHQQIKTEECIVPKGFEEMRETICPGQSS